MKFSKKNFLMLPAVIAFAGLQLVMVDSTWAQGVAPPLGGSTTSHNALPFGWDIPDGSLPPVTVIRDPNGQPWFKDLLGPFGGPFTAVPGDTFDIRERLVIGGNLFWSDWHEDILTPEWEWDLSNPGTNLLANGVSAPGLTITSMPSTLTTGGSIWFDFDPQPVGTLIDINKTLVYVGPPGQTFTGIVQLAEFPTPEPASAGLLAMGGLALLRRRRSRSRKVMD